MAFVPAANGWFGARMPGGAGAGQGRNTNLPPGKVPHPSDIRTGSQGPLGRVRANGHSPCHPEDRAFFLTHTFTQVCHARKGRVPREELGPGARTGCRPRFPPKGSGPGGSGPRPTAGFSRGESGQGSPWWLKV